MHQKGQKHFCELLNCLCVGQLMQNDIQMLNSRIVTTQSIDYRLHARHFFPLRIQCKNHNDAIYNLATTEKQVIQSHDVVVHVKSHKQKNYLTVAQKSKKYDDQKGLLHTLHVAIGLVYILTINMKTEDGLINGTSCTLKHIQYLRPEFPDKPSILWVHFNDENIG